MKLNAFRKGFNFSQDGPGNRLVYHLQGCNMRCGWCSNPEGIAPTGSLLVNPDYLLASVCPHGAVSHGAIDRERCATCTTMECVKENRNQGIRLSSLAYDLESIVDEARRSKPLFYDGGGVTLSGGEVTVQFDAVKALLKRLKEENIHTAIETNGTHPKLAELFRWIDYLIVDFKHYDDQKLREATGVGNRVIKRNLARVFAEHPDALIRIPLIRHFNDSEDDAENFAAFFRQHDTQRASFELLPYHDYGKDKWEKIGLPYRIENGFVRNETPALFEAIFKGCTLKVVHT